LLSISGNAEVPLLINAHSAFEEALAHITPARLSRRSFVVAGALAGILATSKPVAARDALASLQQAITPEAFGALGDGVTPDDDAFKKLLDSIGDGRSATVLLPQCYRLDSEIEVRNRSIKFIGRSSQGSQWTGFRLGKRGAIALHKCNGTSIEDVGFRADPDFLPEHDMLSLFDSSQSSFTRTGFDGSKAEGVRYFRATGSSNLTRFIDLTARGASGEYGFFLGGPMPPDSKTGANIADFSVFSIGARGNCDAIVFDGSSGSVRFTNGAMNFGRRALWAKSTGFLYFSACGWENHTGDYTLQFDRAKTVSLTGCYINGGMQIREDCNDFRVNSCAINSSSYHGCEVAGMQISISDNIIRRNSTKERSTHSGIKLLDSCRNVSVANNLITKEWVFNRIKKENILRNALQRYAIDTDAPAAQGNIITGNVLTEFTEAPIGGAIPTGPHIFGNRVT